MSTILHQIAPPRSLKCRGSAWAASADRGVSSNKRPEIGQGTGPRSLAIAESQARNQAEVRPGIRQSQARNRAESAPGGLGQAVRSAAGNPATADSTIDRGNQAIVGGPASAGRAEAASSSDGKAVVAVVWIWH